MPASLLTDMNNGGGLEDQRALQLALDLSMFGLNTDDEASTALNPSFSEEDHKIKKSANMTECVPVPSSEHVAEIVGRQGCKIKALRAKTNTYIKTPVRGEEPVFVVTGRKEDVTAAKREIISAAEHFSQIRASRRNNGNSAGGPLPPGPPSPSAPGQVTIQVRVPYRVVGLVVGPKGATIKRIQQQTQTYIVTPSRDKEPVFEVTGSPENVEKARAEIEGHIAMRTGGLVDANTNNANHAPGGPGAPSTEDNHLNQLNDFHTNGIDSGFHDLNSDLLGSMYKPPSSNSAFTSYNALNHSNNILSHTSTTHHRTSLTETSNIFTFPAIHNVSTNKLAEFALSNGFTNNHMNGLIYDNDEGIASPTFDPAPRIGPIPIWPDLSRGDPDYCVFGLNSNRDSHPQRSGSLSTPRLSPTLTDSNGSSSPGVSDHDTVRRINSDPLSNGLAAMTTFAPLPHGSSSPESSTSASPTDSGSPDARRRHCMGLKYEVYGNGMEAPRNGEQLEPALIRSHSLK